MTHSTVARAGSKYLWLAGRCPDAMPASNDVIRADFDRIADACAELPDRLEPSASRLLTRVPLRSRVLEIGCGTGALARALARRRGARVTAVDLSPRMIDLARLRTSGSLAIEYSVADFGTLRPRGFDVVIAVNTLHHLPLADAAARMARATVPGGQVLISDLFEARGATELPYNGLSWLVTRPHAHHDDAVAAWAAHADHDRIQPLRWIRSTLASALPGVAIRRHLGWRYTAMWRAAPLT